MTGRKRHFSHKAYVKIIYVSLKHLLLHFQKVFKHKVLGSESRQGHPPAQGLFLLPKPMEKQEALAVQGSVCCTAWTSQCLELGTGMKSPES